MPAVHQPYVPATQSPPELTARALIPSMDFTYITWAAWHWHRGVSAVYAVWRAETSGSRANPDRRTKRGGGGSQQYRGQAHRDDVVQKDATVCICHAKTRDLAQFTILADILVVAAGKPNLIVPQMVKTGAVVIDVGINRLPNGKIVGDVDFAGVSQKASHITPVPAAWVR